MSQITSMTQFAAFIAEVQQQYGKDVAVRCNITFNNMTSSGSKDSAAVRTIVEIVESESFDLLDKPAYMR